jgi:excisionase family DNA binding protein
MHEQEFCVLVDEVAKHLGIAKNTVYTWISAKGMPADRVGRLWQFKRDEVDGWVKYRGAADRQDVDPSGKEGR